MGTRHKGKLYLRKKQFFVILVEKYLEDAKQDEKRVPDLLESIMKAPGLVKEEKQRLLFKMNQFGSDIQEFEVLPLRMSEN